MPLIQWNDNSPVFSQVILVPGCARLSCTVVAMVTCVRSHHWRVPKVRLRPKRKKPQTIEKEGILQGISDLGVRNLRQPYSRHRTVRPSLLFDQEHTGHFWCFIMCPSAALRSGCTKCKELKTYVKKIYCINLVYLDF